MQRLQGGPVMRVVEVSERPDGGVLIETVVVPRNGRHPEQYLPEELKVIGSDADEDFENGDDSDREGSED